MVSDASAREFSAITRFMGAGTFEAILLVPFAKEAASVGVRADIFVPPKEPITYERL